MPRDVSAAEIASCGRGGACLFCGAVASPAVASSRVQEVPERRRLHANSSRAMAYGQAGDFLVVMTTRSPNISFAAGSTGRECFTPFCALVAEPLAESLH